MPLSCVLPVLTPLYKSLKALPAPRKPLLSCKPSKLEKKGVESAQIVPEGRLSLFPRFALIARRCSDCKIYKQANRQPHQILRSWCPRDMHHFHFSSIRARFDTSTSSRTSFFVRDTFSWKQIDLVVKSGVLSSNSVFF